MSYYNLYDLDFLGCRSCLLCKKKGATPRHCYWDDDLSPIIDEIFESDSLVIGSPIYLSDLTSQIHALLERLIFVNLSYLKENKNPFKGKINIALVYTMNATEEQYKTYLDEKLQNQVNFLSSLNGEIMVLPCFDTLQVKDYSKYDIDYFDGDAKLERHNTIFNEDLDKAFNLGVNLSKL